jgi:hypothetical protein
VTSSTGPPSSRERGRIPAAARVALIVLGAAAAGLLLLEHRAHVLGTSPLLVLLIVCIAAHFFMHRGHGRGGGHEH